MNAKPATPAAAAPAREPLKELDQALAELLALAAALPNVESVRTFDGDGRVLAQDLTATNNVPAHDNSAMDGYALRSADWQSADTVLPVSQRVPAGVKPSGLQPLAAASVARIFTGAPIPPGADAV